MEILIHQANFIQSNHTHTAIIGGYGCFLDNQKIVTPTGLVNLSNLKAGDSVNSFNQNTKKVEVKKVVNTFKYKADEYFCIKLKDGTEINVTKDHKFFFNNKWIEIHKILDLFDKKHYL
jgi:hypothetical protein